MESKAYTMKEEITRGQGEALFDYIAECLANFLKSQGIDEEILPLGFTFSFPCRQNGLASGELIQWTKGFTCSGVEGQDVVALLKSAIARIGDIIVNVTSLINDTTGCLVSCAWNQPNCKIGLIIGTGTNACYIENVDKVGIYRSEGRNREGIVRVKFVMLRFILPM